MEKSNGNRNPKTGYNFVRRLEGLIPPEPVIDETTNGDETTNDTDTNGIDTNVNGGNTDTNGSNGNDDVDVNINGTDANGNGVGVDESNGDGVNGVINAVPQSMTTTEAIDSSTLTTLIESLSDVKTQITNQTNNLDTQISQIPSTQISPQLINTTINLHILSYDENGKLVPATNPSDSVTHPLKTNLKNYLKQFKLLTDEINILDGKVINFGVEFEVVAHRGMNKADVKLRVIDKIKNYFTTDKMQFRQPLYTNDVIYEVMGVEGVRSVNKLELVQKFSDALGDRPLYYFTHTTPTGDNQNGDSRYNWQYDFASFYGKDPQPNNPNVNAIGSEGVILPSVEPSVFELKFPNRDIRGKVL